MWCLCWFDGREIHCSERRVNRRVMWSEPWALTFVLAYADSLSSSMLLLVQGQTVRRTMRIRTTFATRLSTVGMWTRRNERFAVGRVT